MSALYGLTSERPRYNTLSRLTKQDDSPSTSSISRLLLAQRKTFGSPSRLPVRNVDGVASQCFTPPGRTYDKLVMELPPQAQVLKSSVAGIETVGCLQPLDSENQILPESNALPVKRISTRTSHGQTAVPTSLHSNQTSNLNYAEIAELLEHESSDEVESAVDPSHVVIDGYKLKEEFAFLLKSILSKYADIAKNSLLKSSTSHSFLLERLCGISQKLETRVFTGIKTVEVHSMLFQLHDLEIANLEVGWLRQRLQDISDALMKSKAYPALKREKEKSTKDLEAVDERIRLAEEEHAALIAEVEKIIEKVSEAKEKMLIFLPSLVDGLL